MFELDPTYEQWNRAATPIRGTLPEQRQVEGIAIASLEPGTMIVVHTWNSQYRLLVLFDPCLVAVKGGKMFTDATVVRLAGATAGGSALKIGWVLVGLGIEFQDGVRRVISSPVRSISIERIPAIPAA